MGPSRGRRYSLLALMLAGFGIILFRLVTLQVLQAAELTARAVRPQQCQREGRRKGMEAAGRRKETSFSRYCERNGD